VSEPDVEPSVDPTRVSRDADSDEPAPDHAPAADLPPAAAPRRARPWLERIGMAAIAAVMAALFGGVAAAAWIGQEPFLAVMAGIGCLMTAWVGGMTLFRG
jgi:hypothetical protein